MSTELTLVVMHLPEFRRGYFAGRNDYIREQTLLSDKELLECLTILIAEGDQAAIEYNVGRFIGRMSGAVIPRTALENDQQERQAQLLASLRASFGENADELVTAVSRMWEAQDYLARLLDVQTYEKILKRDAPPAMRLVRSMP